MKPIEKEFCQVGNSKGIIIEKILFTESEIKPTDKVLVTCRKNYITIKKKQEE